MHIKYINSEDSKSVLIFSVASVFVELFAFCDFSQPESWEIYPGLMVPTGGRNWQLIYPNWRRA